MKSTMSNIQSVNPLNSKNVITHKKVMKLFRKMGTHKKVLELHFDPLGCLDVNGEEKEKPDDFLLYYKGNLYARIGGDYHCTGKLADHYQLVAAVQGKKFISERDDGYYDYSSRKVLLPKSYSLMALFKNGNKINLLIADANICSNIRVITLKDTIENEFLLSCSFSNILNRRDPYLSAFLQKWTDDYMLVEKSTSGRFQ